VDPLLVDNREVREALVAGGAAVGVRLSAEQVDALLRFAEELLRWNARVNLTAITEIAEVVEKHLVDSLAVVPLIGAAGTALDLGSGAGLPAVPLKIALPQLQVTAVESVGKKVAFIKHAAARLGLGGGFRAIQARAAGEANREGLLKADVVVSRALMELSAWARLGSAYLAPCGRLIAMLGKATSGDELQAAGASAGLRLESVRSYRLPTSGAERSLAVFVSR
jgi:16S rRNA (guanine527-N7)-methyltransferase